MAKYYRRKEDGLYETSRKLPNGKRQVFRGKTCKEVDDKILAFQLEQDYGREFSAVADDWWESLESVVAPSTVASYKAYFDRAEDYFGEIRIGKIDVQQLQRFITGEAKKGYKYGTINQQIVVLNQIFQYAFRCGEIKHNPAKAIERPRHLERGVRPPLTLDQQKVVQNYRGEYSLMPLMLLYTGMRIGELMALEWKDVDFKAGVIHITKKLNYSPRSSGTLENYLKSKNGKRDIPLFGPLRDILPKNRIGPLFCRPDGTHFARHHKDQFWAAFCRDAGLADSDGKPVIQPHQMRHCFATICYEADIDIKTVAGWMGDTEDVVSKIYQALRPHQEQKGIEQINSYFEEMEEA